MVSRVMEWRDRLIEKGLDEEIADELVVGLPEQLAGADDVRALKRGLERAEETLTELRVDVARIDERLKAVEQAVVDLRNELRDELRATREGVQRSVENETAGRRANTRLLLAVIALASGTNIAVVTALITLLD